MLEQHYVNNNQVGYNALLLEIEYYKLNAKLFILPVYDDLATRIADPNKMNTPHTKTVNCFESNILVFKNLRYKI